MAITPTTQIMSPANSEFVDQFNRAEAFGQINTSSGITPGSLNPDVIIGTALTYSSPGIRVAARWSNVDLATTAAKVQYSVLGSPTDVYGGAFIAPAGSRCIVESMFAVVRTVANGTITTNPQVRPYIGGTVITSANQGDTTLQLAFPLSLGGTVPANGCFSSANVLVSPGKAFLAGGASPQLIVTTALTGTATTYKVDFFAYFVVLPAAV